MGSERADKALKCALAGLVLLVAACGEFIGFSDPPEPDLGAIAKIRIYLSETALRQLYDSVFEDDFAPCTAVENGVSRDAWIQVRGFTSRAYPKKSFTLKYEDGEREERYALERLTGSGAANRLAMFAYSIAYRDGEPTTKKALPAPDVTGAALFINDTYLGAYNKITIYGEDELRTHYEGRPGELFKCFFLDMGYDVPLESLTEKKFPDDDDFSSLNRLIYNAHYLSDPEWESWVDGHINREDIVRYLVVHDYLGVADTFRTNFYVYNYGKMLMLPWDNEASFRIGSTEYGGDNLLTLRLAQDPTIRSEYNSEMQRLFMSGTADVTSDPLKFDLSNPEGTDPIIDDLIVEANRIFTEIDRAMYYDPTSYVTYENFLSAQSDVLSFLYNRSAEIPTEPLP